jgi:hypothetical protein
MDLGPDEPSLTLSFCRQHGQLLSRYQNALEAWAMLCEESWHLTSRGKEFDGELMRLQSEFASSYATLHKHSRDCMLCRLGENLSNRNSASSSFDSPRRLPD